MKEVSQKTKKVKRIPIRQERPSSFLNFLPRINLGIALNSGFVNLKVSLEGNVIFNNSWDLDEIFGGK